MIISGQLLTKVGGPVQWATITFDPSVGDSLSFETDFEGKYSCDIPVGTYRVYKKEKYNIDIELLGENVAVDATGTIDLESLIDRNTSPSYTAETLPDPASLGAGSTVFVDGLPAIVSKDSELIPIVGARIEASPEAVGLTPEALSFMGVQEDALTAVYGKGLKDIQPQWLMSGRALDTGAIDTDNGIYHDKFIRDYSSVIPENGFKWVVNEPVKGNVTFQRARDTVSQVPTVTQKAMHTLFGRDIYLPSWAITELSESPEAISTLVAKRISDVAQEYPDGSFYRVDVVNEVLNEAPSNATAGNYTATRGWRMSANSLYEAGKSANPANPSQWIWDAFTQAKLAWPSARLAWVDYLLEVSHPCDSYNVAMLPARYRTNTKSGNTVSFVEKCAFFNNNDRAALVSKTDRLRYEVWHALQNGVPIDVVGYQMHIDVLAPPNFNDLALQMEDWNRFGVIPAITELNVRNTAFSSPATLLPPHLQQSGSRSVNRYGAVLAYHYVNTFLKSSLCDEVSFWSPGYDVSGDGQTATVGDVDYPVRAAVALALASAQAPESRTLKRGSRINCRFVMPLWVEFVTGSAANLTFSSNRTAIAATTGTSLQVPWGWFSAEWMDKPIDPAGYVLTSQFQVSASIGAQTVLMGLGNSKTAPTDYIQLVVNGTTLSVEYYVAGVLVTSQTIGTVTTAQDQRVAVKVDGSNLSWSLNGGAVSSVALTSTFTTQTSLYLLSAPNATKSSPNLSAAFFEVHHADDYPGDAALKSLATPIIRDCSIGAYSGY